MTELRGVYKIPSLHKALIPFPANIDKQILLPKGGKPKASCVLISICNDPAGYRLGRGGPMNPPQKEQCGKTVYTVQVHWARGAKTRSPYN